MSKTYCTYKEEKHEVAGFTHRSDEYINKYLELYNWKVNLVLREGADTGRPKLVDLVLCSNFRQE